jgi:hypothetical protein
MTVLEEGIYSYLSGYAGLVAKVGTRVYPVRFPQSTIMPCVVYQRIDTPRITTMDSSGSSGDLINPRFQFEVWAETYDEAKDICDILRAALNGKTGTMGGVTIRASLGSNETVEYSPEFELYRFQTDYIIWQEE